MKSKLAISVTMSGWIIFTAYFAYYFPGYGGSIFRHFSGPDHAYDIFLQGLIFLMPVISTALGYLVHERTKLLLDISASEGKYRDLYENAPDGYHSLAEDGTFVGVNGTWLKMLGYDRDEVMGRMKLPEILAEGSISAFEKGAALLKEKGYIENLEVAVRKKDGTILPVVINAKAVYDGKGRFLKARSIVRDNSLKKGYEMILRRASDEWRATFDSMPNGVMLLDSEGNIIKTNKYIAELAGTPLKEVLYRKCHDVIHEKDRKVEGCPLERSIKSGLTESSEYYDDRLGKYFVMSVTPVIDEDNIAVAYAHSVVDITHIKEKEKKLQDSRNAFFNMLKDVDNAYKRLEKIYHGLVLSFANAIDAKSPWTKGHSERVACYALDIAREMGLKDRELDTLKTAALLHDIGKIGTYDVILEKPDKLTND